MNLDDLHAFASLDSGGLLAQIDDLPARLEHAWIAGQTLPLPEMPGLRSVLITAIDEAAIAGELLQVYLAAHSPIPVLVWRDYGLPGWATGPQHLVIAVSHDGETQETLHAFAQAELHGCSRLAICNAGSLGTDAGSTPVWMYSHPGPASQALADQFALLLSVAVRLGLIHADTVNQDLVAACAALRQQQERLFSSVPVSKNLAKRIAGQALNRLTVLFAADLLVPVAHRWKAQINRMAQAWAQVEVLPEADHNTLAGTLQPEAALNRMLTLFLVAPSNNPSNLVRLELTRQVMMVSGFNTDFIQATGETRLSQLWTSLHFGDYMAYYLAMAYGVDPLAGQGLQAFEDEVARR